MKNNNLLLLVIIIAMLTGCSNTYVYNSPDTPVSESKKIIVFLDGTNNDERSHTNVYQLHNLINQQNNNAINTAYVEGVGTSAKILGLAMGWGIGQDVRQGYQYIAKTYQYGRQDEIYLFGFSRGSYAARILASLLNVAGVPNINGLNDAEIEDLIENIYDEFKSKQSINQRRLDVAKVLGTTPTPVKVKFMGIWDTVEALGFPDFDENIDLPNTRYADQLCNIEKAAHALSVDDDRARIFTPILLTRDHLVQQCESPVNINDIVEEVWFAGAHSDVGGGYDNTQINGVSLNWMLSQIAPFNLLPATTKVIQEPLGVTNDPEAGIIWGALYHRLNRDLPRYARTSQYNNKKLKIHHTVFERLAQIPIEFHEFGWNRDINFKHCFDTSSNNTLIYKQSSECFDVIN